jgi:hypothetical protein
MPSMKSMQITCQAYVGTGRGWSNPGVHTCSVWLLTEQVATNWRSVSFIVGHEKYFLMR